MHKDKQTKTYRPTSRHLLMESFSFLLASLGLGIVVCTLMAAAGSLYWSEVIETGANHPFYEDNVALFTPLLVISLVVTVVSGTLWVFLALGQVSRLFCRRLETSPHGLTHHIRPYYTLTCTWDDVDHVDNVHFPLGHADVLRLKRATLSGWRIPIKLERLAVFSGTDTFVTLSSFEGWPHGRLAEDLRTYAPQLFEHKAL